MPSDTRDRIIELQGAGLSVRQIAASLGISTQAVYWHLKRLEEQS